MYACARKVCGETDEWARFTDVVAISVGWTLDAACPVE